MFVKLRRFSTVCEQVTTYHMAKEQQLGFESDPCPFAACLRLSLSLLPVLFTVIIQ